MQLVETRFLTHYFTEMFLELSEFSRTLLKLFLVGVCFTQCMSPSPREQMYYQQPEHNKDVIETAAILEVNNTDSVIHFLKGRTFSYKTNRLEFDDSLCVSFFNNGKLESKAVCTVESYLIHSDRLLLFTESGSSRKVKYTLSADGTMTDITTYAHFKPEEN